MRTWLRRASAVCAAVPAVPAAVVSSVTPAKQVSRIIANGTRRWIRCAPGGNQGESWTTFEFPPAGGHAWPYRGAQPQALETDLIATLKG